MFKEHRKRTNYDFTDYTGQKWRDLSFWTDIRNFLEYTIIIY